MDYHTLLYTDTFSPHNRVLELSLRKLDSKATILSTMLVTKIRAGAGTSLPKEKKLIIIVAASIGGTVIFLVIIITLLLRSRKSLRNPSAGQPQSARKDRRLSTRSGNKVTLWSNLWSTLATTPTPASADGALLKISPDSIRGKSFFRVDQGRSAAIRNPWDSRIRLSKPLTTVPLVLEEKVQAETPALPNASDEKSPGRDYFIPSYYHSAASETAYTQFPPVPQRKVVPVGQVIRSGILGSAIPSSSGTVSSHGLSFLHDSPGPRDKPATKMHIENSLGEKEHLAAGTSKIPHNPAMIRSRFQPPTDPDKSTGPIKLNISLSLGSPERPGRARKESVTIPRSIFVQPQSTGRPLEKSQRLTAVSPLRAPASLLRSLSGRLPRSESGDTEDRATIRWVSPHSDADSNERSPEIYFEMRPYSPTTSCSRSAVASTHANATRRQAER